MTNKILTALVAIGIAPIGLATAQNVITVTSENFGKTVVISGTVAAKKSVTLTAQFSGRVMSIAGKEGDRFNAGTVLVTMDEAGLRAKLGAAISAQHSAQANYRNAQVQLNREIASPNDGGMMNLTPMKMMSGGGKTTVDRRSDIFSRRTQVEQARMAIQSAQSQIQQLHVKLNQTKSIAPFSGVIISKKVEVGDTVSMGMPLLEFADTQDLEIRADVPARLAAGLNLGMAIAIKTNGSNGWIKAPLTNIFPVADRVRHVVPIKITLPGHIKGTAGMYAEVMIPDQKSHQRSLLTIPVTAVVNKGGLPMVFLVNPNGKAVLRSVRLGQASEGKIGVIAGLRNGDSVVVKPRPGMRSGETP